MTYNEAEAIKQIVDDAKTIVVLQADNPDADSLGSSLALEHILGDQGKSVVLYCAVDIPGYLHYLPGWDRVGHELPRQFDASIIVDASTFTLFEKLQSSGEMHWLSTRPSVVLDHHATVENRIDFARVTLYDEHTSSCSELVCNLSSQLNWHIDPEAGACLMTGILGDTQGLSNDLASADTYRVMADLVDLGVDRPTLEEQRREYNRMSYDIFRYKAKLIDRTELAADGRIAYVTVPQAEITTYSPLYNPVPLIQNDLLNISGVMLTIVFKQYNDGKVTGAIRANSGYAVADKLAEHMGGGGHPYASGFKQVTRRPFNEIKSECLSFATKLLSNIDKEHSDEVVQYAF
jgi:phosphoesterase RecJ-like protein